eukprot:gene7442-7652_t
MFASVCKQRVATKISSIIVRERPHGKAVRVRAAFDGQPLQRKNVQEKITFFTAEGLVQIRGRTVEVYHPNVIQPFPSWEEQGLVVGATFAVAATNGRDPARRINILGYCQSTDILQECVQDTVVERGGEILDIEKRLKSGVHEQLSLTVCIPFLWGVPPEVDALSAAILEGGGIVDKVYQQWGMYRHAAYAASLRRNSC